MVAPDSVALVVRQRGGPNLIVHTYVLLRYRCSKQEAVTIMGRFALGRGQTDVDGSGDIHPKFSHDKLLVLNGRYAVVYRLVHKVWVMAVTVERCNTLVSVRLVETATKGLVATCQILEVDNEVVGRNYQEVYFMMGAILKYQGVDLQKSQSEALANIFSYIADSREKKGKAVSDSSKRATSMKAVTQKLTEFSGVNQNLNFIMPADFKQLQNPTGLPAPMGFNVDFGQSPVKAKQIAPMVQSSFKLEDLVPAAPPPATAVAPAQSGFTDLDDLLGTSTPAPVIVRDRSLDFFAVEKGPPPLAAITTSTPNESNWFDFGAAEKPQPVPMPQQPIAPPQQAMSALQRPVEPFSPPRSGPALYLMEKWEGTYEGGKCTSSKALGEVGLRKHLWKQAAGKDLKFQLCLQKDTMEPSRGMKYLMKSARHNPERTSAVKDGVFSAKMKPAPSPYLIYRLLPGCYDIPVRVHVTAGVGSFRDQSRCLILLIQVSSSAKNRSAANGSMFVWLPRRLGSPLFARPRPQFSQKQSCLKWTFQQFQPNQHILFKAVLPMTNDIDEELIKSIRVEMNCAGRPGNTFSGVSLSQQLSHGSSSLEETPEVSLWTASVVARP